MRKPTPKQTFWKLALVGLLVILSACVAGKVSGLAWHMVFSTIFLPLVGPAVAVLVPTWLFFVEPSRKSQQEASLEILKLYFGEYMRQARLTTWDHFGAEFSRSIDHRPQMGRYLDYLANPDVNLELSETEKQTYQQISTLLDFFAIVEDMLTEDALDKTMLMRGLAYYYAWWRDDLIAKLREMPLPPPKNGRSRPQKFVPLW